MNQSGIASQIKTALNSLVGSRVFYRSFPQPPEVPVWPGIRYSFVSNVPDSSWCGDGNDEAADYIIQIDVVDLQSKGVTSFFDLCAQVKNKMAVDLPGWLRVGYAEADDSETKTYRMVLDYSVKTSN